MASLENSLGTVPAAILRRALSGLRNAVVITDAIHPERPVLFCNEAFCELTGFSAHEIIGRNCRFLRNEPAGETGINDLAFAQLRQAIREKRPCRIRVRNYRKDGTPIWTDMSVSPVLGADGFISHFIGVQVERAMEGMAGPLSQRDDALLEERVAERTHELAAMNNELRDRLTEVLHANHELNEAREQFRSIFANAVEGMYQSSPEGWYIRVNPALARMYGYSSPRDMLSSISSISEQIYVDASAQETFARLIHEQGEVRGLEYRVRRKDGVIIWISEHARAVCDAGGRLKYYEGSIQDITARKQAETDNASLEAQLLQAQKMEAIGTLAGGIAHDFNNMLSAILGYAHLAQGCAVEPRQREYLSHVLQASQRASDLVKQILAFSRRSLPEKRTVNLGLILREVTKLLRASVPSTVEIALEVDNADGAEVLGDPVQFHQVFMNLATNAAYAMRDRCGSLTFRLKRVVVAAGAHPGLPCGHYLEVCVADTGTGIPPEVMCRIFEPFFTTKPVGEGTGMGLSVVHGIVRSHGGDITVTSTPGQGTTFRVLLPAHQSQDVRDHVPAAPPFPGSERVILVDDEASLVEMMAEMLGSLGYKVVSFTRAGDALQYIQSRPQAVDLLITDQTMPKLTGLELIAQVRECRADLPVVLCSGYGDSDLVTRAHQARVCFAPKPISLRELSATMRTVLSVAAN